jgi:arylformamidase
VSRAVIDISQPLRNGIPPWPGDTPFHFEPTARIGDGGSVVNVGRFEASCHTGTHIDAPFHFDGEGKKVHELDLSLYVGRARVIEIRGSESVGESELSEHSFDGTTRLLVKTGAWTERDVFPESVVHFRPDAAPYLASRGVRLVGTEMPSVDPVESKELPAHHALHERGIHILEGVVLDGVEPGEYELVALPLPIRDGDGSPVRAALREAPFGRGES